MNAELLAKAIEDRRDRLAAEIVARHYELRPDLLLRYGPGGRQKCIEDARHHLSNLGDALRFGSLEMFTDYVKWARILLERRGIPVTDLQLQIEIIRDVLLARLPGGTDGLLRGCVQGALSSLQQQIPAALEVDRCQPLSPLAQGYLQCLIGADRRAAARLVLDAAKAGMPVRDIYLGVLQPVQHEIGRLWQMNKMSIAQEHYCTAVTQLVMSQLFPYVLATEKKGRMMVATSVSGDLHVIGIRMLADLFEMDGWDTYYLGASTPLVDVVRTLAERRALLLCVSVTMTYHVRAVAELIRAVRASSKTRADGVKVLVGGRPFNAAPELWRAIDADGFAPDGAGAVDVANGLMTASARV